MSPASSSCVTMASNPASGMSSVVSSGQGRSHRRSDQCRVIPVTRAEAVHLHPIVLGVGSLLQMSCRESGRIRRSHITYPAHPRPRVRGGDRMRVGDAHHQEIVREREDLLESRPDHGLVDHCGLVRQLGVYGSGSPRRNVTSDTSQPSARRSDANRSAWVPNLARSRERTPGGLIVDGLVYVRPDSQRVGEAHAGADGAPVRRPTGLNARQWVNEARWPAPPLVPRSEVRLRKEVAFDGLDDRRGISRKGERRACARSWWQRSRCF